jgi:hypothetical protein
VSKVPLIPSNEEDDFKKQYVNQSYVAYESDEGKERLANVVDLMWKRWDWLQKHENLCTYVNMLRVQNHTDEAIQAMCDGKRPMCFARQRVYQNFCSSLADLRGKMEKELGWSDIRFGQTGSSVPGFSQNPVKGFADRPSKITSAKKSDVDIFIVAKGAKELYETLEAKGEKIKIYPTTSNRSTPREERRWWGKGDDFVVAKCLKPFQDSWGSKLCGGVQFTIQMSPNPSIAPWEIFLPIKTGETYTGLFFFFFNRGDYNSR